MQCNRSAQFGEEVCENFPRYLSIRRTAGVRLGHCSGLLLRGGTIACQNTQRVSNMIFFFPLFVHPVVLKHHQPLFGVSSLACQAECVCSVPCSSHHLKKLPLQIRGSGNQISSLGLCFVPCCYVSSGIEIRRVMPDYRGRD